MKSEQNIFIRNISNHYSSEFAKDGARIGSTLRIRLPNDYVVTDGPLPSKALPITAHLPTSEFKIGVAEAGVIVASAAIAKNPTVSRRFWDWLK